MKNISLSHDNGCLRWATSDTLFRQQVATGAEAAVSQLNPSLTAGTVLGHQASSHPAQTPDAGHLTTIPRSMAFQPRSHQAVLGAFCQSISEFIDSRSRCAAASTMGHAWHPFASLITSAPLARRQVMVARHVGSIGTVGHFEVHVAKR